MLAATAAWGRLHGNWQDARGISLSAQALAKLEGGQRKGGFHLGASSGSNLQRSKAVRLQSNALYLLASYSQHSVAKGIFAANRRQVDGSGAASWAPGGEISLGRRRSGNLGRTAAGRRHRAAIRGSGRWLAAQNWLAAARGAGRRICGSGA
ncbi:hypothetical protein J5N97_010773 [Dioscorea zingiberensis]|uniref:Uncharacterized protein n=1 Tax=Dioscorea zingiberensis TaxID=325984 RepID=A0A9D5HMZ2_9LILI|nr:hypothetical protein J5N97_010773 [Dioscorea zingiberensis]